jgi:hypothetical protein
MAALDFSGSAAPVAPLDFTAHTAPKPKLPDFSSHAIVRPDFSAGAVQPTSFAHDLGDSFLDVPREAVKQNEEAFHSVKGDFTAPVTSKKGGKPGVMDYAARAGRTGLDAANYGSGMAMATGALTSLFGRPVEKVTGIPKQTTGDVLSFALPFAGDIKAAYSAGKIADGTKAVQKLFSPTSVAPEAGRTERVIRRATGEGDLAAEKASATLIKHNALVGNMPVNDQRALIHHIEDPSNPAFTPADPRLRQTAAAIRQVYDTYKSRIVHILGPQGSPHFIDDYYAHLWKDSPGNVQGKLRSYYSKQGTGANFKKRSIPTIADGLAAGLTPKFENPIESTMAYARNMSRFLATHDIQNTLKDMRYAKWFQPGKAPPGWVPLKGIMTDKVANIPGSPAKIELHAPEHVARIYNNYISKGFEGHKDVGPFWIAARHLANGLLMMKMGLSAFHSTVMSNEGFVGEVARAISAASRGQMKTAGRAAIGAPAAPVSVALRGRRMGQELLDVKMPDALSKKINEQFVRSGGRLHMDPFYRTRAAGSFFDAIGKGTFKRELGDALKAVTRGTPSERVKGVVDLTANTIQSVAAPLFERYIPAIKRGAFAQRMGDFIKSNPGATQEELDKYSVKLNDSMDNRFGELIQDNLFWHKQMKQISQIVLLAAGWDIGTMREIVGGISDVLPNARETLAGKGVTDRTAYVAALAATMALENGVATYLKTGSTPHGMDFAAYRTGGTDASSGQPERAILPSYEKDVLGFGYDFPHNILNESINKLNPVLSEPIQLLRNKDYRDLPIYRPEGVAPVEGEPTTFDYLLEQNMPISFSTIANAKQGSNLSTFERVMGIRPAPSYVQDPQGTADKRTYFNTLEWNKRLKADARQKAKEQ